MADYSPIGMLPIYDEGSLDDPGEYCCDFLKQQLTGNCRGPEGHITNTVQCPDQLVCYSAKIREYSLNPIGLPHYTIHYCPSCGTKFPDSLRERWFEELEKSGISAPFEKGVFIPKHFQTDSWWKNN